MRRDRITVACATCGASLERKRYWALRSPTHFCNRTCRDADPRMVLSERFALKVNRTGSCWLWTGTKTNAGYGRVYVHGNDVAQAHRVAWELVEGPIPEGLDVLHTCDVRLCVRNDEVGIYIVDGQEFYRRGHLFLGTQAVNDADKVAKQRQTRGEAQHTAKLTEADVREIKAALAIQCKGYAAIARKYGVTPRIIQLIARGELWTHVA